MTTRRGWGKVRKLPSGNYQASYIGPDVTRHAAPTTYTSRMEAEGWLRDERRRIEADDWTPPEERRAAKLQKGQTFGEYAETWLANRRTTRGEPLKPRTAAEYRRYLDVHILPTLGGVPLPQLTEPRVTAWFESLDPRAPTARAHAYQLMNAICSTATSRKLLPVNPCTIDGAGKVERAKRIRPAELDELDVIVGAMPQRLRLAVLLGSWCALRYGEIAELRRKDVDVDRGIITVERGVTWPAGVATVGTPKSRAGNRDVDVPPHLLPAIAAHLDEHTAPGRSALLFPAANGGHLHPRTFGKRFNQARAAAGRPDLTFHTLRHTGAVLAAQSGATLAELMARLGHSTPGAALRYQHAGAARGKAIAAALSKMAEGA